MGTGHDSQWQYRAPASGDWVFGAGPAGMPASKRPNPDFSRPSRLESQAHPRATRLAHEVLATTNPRSPALCRCCKDARLLTDGLRSGSFCPYDPTSGTGRPLIHLYNCYLAGARQCGVDKRFRRGESRFEAIRGCQALKSGGDAKHGGRSSQEHTVQIQ